MVVLRKVCFSLILFEFSSVSCLFIVMRLLSMFVSMFMFFC